MSEIKKVEELFMNCFYSATELNSDQPEVIGEMEDMFDHTWSVEKVALPSA